MMKWHPFSYDDLHYGLDHLHPFELKVTQPAKGVKPARSYHFIVEFSMHCFTYKINQGNCEDAKLFYSDHRETRIFCFKRYEWSQHLPEIIRKRSL